MFAIHTATEIGDIKTVKRLLNLNPTSVNAAYLGGETPLHFAASANNIAMAKLLLTAGANIDSQNNHGGTPLHFSAGMGHINMVSFLIHSDAQVNLADKDGLTPLHIAVSEGHTEIVTLLITKNANSNFKNHKGVSPLDEAKKKGNNKIIELLSAVNKKKKQWWKFWENEAQDIKPHDFELENDISASAEVHFNQGLLFVQQGDKLDAIKEFKAALHINPNLIEAHFNLGVLYGQQGLREDARRELKIAAESGNVGAKQVLATLERW